MAEDENDMPVPTRPAATPKPVESQQVKLAEQKEFEIDGYRMPGLAFNDNGAITLASLTDLFMVCLASMGHPKVDEILQKNDVVLRDKEGKIYFPRPNSNTE